MIGTPMLTRGARFRDYFFGRSALLGLASFMLLIISGYATWHGMRDFIIGTSTTIGDGHESASIMSNDVLVIAVVCALTFLMWLALHETFGAQRRLRERLITFPLYLFLAIWSIGFGYGFWWSLISGEEATRMSLTGLQEDARDASSAVSARLQSVRTQLDGVVSWSDNQMSREEKSGGSCGLASNAGRGPLFNARRSVRDSVSSLRDEMEHSWFGPAQSAIDQLGQMATKQAVGTFEARQKIFEQEASGIRGKARDIATRSNEMGRSAAAGMKTLVASVVIGPGAVGFTCYDPTLAQRLSLAADQAQQPAELKLRDAAFSEGPAGVANAVKRLWENVGNYSVGLASYFSSGGVETAHKSSSSGTLTGRDLIALLAAIGVDFGLLALMALNPSPIGPVRRDALAATQAKVRLPTASAIQSLRSALHTAITQAPDINHRWVSRHFIHHDGANYLVIPNLFSVDQENADEELRALAINQLAGVFTDLKLVRALTPSVLKRLKKEEQRDSHSDLNHLQHSHDKTKSQKQPTTHFWKQWAGAVTDASTQEGPDCMRNHGLLSKAQRALDIAGWSVAAQNDIEIFQLENKEGITPILALLSENPQDQRAVLDMPPRRPVALTDEKPLLLQSARSASKSVQPVLVDDTVG